MIRKTLPKLVGTVSHCAINTERSGEEEHVSPKSGIPMEPRRPNSIRRQQRNQRRRQHPQQQMGFR